MIETSFIIVTYNSSSTIQNCLDSIFSQFDLDSFEVIVVDNASSDSTIDTVNHYPLKVNLIENKTNAGFAAGNNIGVMHSTGKYIIFLNPDAVLDPHSSNHLINTLKNEKNVGCIGGWERALDSIKSELPSIQSVIKDWAGKTQKVKPNSELLEVDWVSGSYLAIEKELFVKLMGFDERFFLYYEETDLCRKARSLGYKNYLHSKAKLRHIGGVSALKTHPKLANNNTKMIKSFEYYSQLLYLNKNHGVFYTLFHFLFEITFRIISITNQIFKHKNSVNLKSRSHELKMLLKAIFVTRLGYFSPSKPWKT